MGLMLDELYSQKSKGEMSLRIGALALQDVRVTLISFQGGCFSF
jgi:hypothetical protein